MTKFIEGAGLPILFVVLAVCIAAVLVLSLDSSMDRVEWHEETYIVEQGDSLWSISGKFCPDNVDRNEWSARVRLLNDLPESIIFPGDVLTVLAPEEGLL